MSSYFAEAPKGNLIMLAAQSRLPGTRMNSTSSAASTVAVTANTIRARFASSLRTYGSRTREKLNGVYSLRPIRASTGSREY